MRTGRSSISTLVCAAAALAVGGCADTYVQRLARFDPQSNAGATVAVAAPETDVYQVKWRGIDDEQSASIRRLVRKGDPLGFVSESDGRVFAIAGPEKFPLTDLPASSDSLAWRRKVRRGADMDLDFKPDDGAFESAVGAAAGVALQATAAMLDSSSKCEDHDEPRRRRSRSRSREPVEIPARN